MLLEGVGFANGKIIFDEPDKVYYSGQVISGNVHFELNESFSFSAINITFLGEARVHWSEGQREMYNGVTQYKEVNYEGREVYFNISQCLYGGAGMSTLPVGLQSLPFTFQVPFNVPSSYEADKGEITYSITVSVEHLLPEKRQTLQDYFDVVAPLYNVNMQPIELDPEEVYACSCFCTNTSVKVKLTLPTNTFNLGSTIPVTVLAKDNAKAEISDIIFKVTMKRVFRTQQPVSTSITPEVVLVEEKSGQLPAGDFTCHLQLPDMVLPNLQNCGVMDVSYYLKVKIELNGCNDDIDDESEIYIGLIPSTDSSQVNTGTLAQHLPNAAVPRPNNPLETTRSFPTAGAFKVPNITPYPNGTPKYPSNETLMIPNLNSRFGVALNNSQSAVSSPNLNYPGNHFQGPQIGFRVPNSTPYPGNAMPMPVLPNTGTAPYPGESFSFSSSQPRLIVTPSAPPL